MRGRSSKGCACTPDGDAGLTCSPYGLAAGPAQARAQVRVTAEEEEYLASQHAFAVHDALHHEQLELIFALF